MSKVHIFTAAKQPMTRYRYDMGFKKVIVRTPPRKQFRCLKCWRMRWAKNLVIQVYYDTHYIWCVEGCKAITYEAKRAFWRRHG